MLGTGAVNTVVGWGGGAGTEGPAELAPSSPQSKTAGDHVWTGERVT